MEIEVESGFTLKLVAFTVDSVGPYVFSTSTFFAHSFKLSRLPASPPDSSKRSVGNASTHNPSITLGVNDAVVT
ncbi:hypothetical protein D3C77_446900 [compost metagenome]